MSKIKIIAAIVVILGILVLLFGSTTLNLPVIGDIGKYLNLPSFIPLFNPTPSGNAFSFSLSTLSNSLDGQTLTAQNSNIVLLGTNFITLQVGDSSYQPGNGATVQIYNFNGQAQFSYGTVILNGQADSVVLNSVSISSTSGQKLKIISQFSTANYTISSLSKQPLVLQNVYGTLKKTSGSSATEDLQNESLRIDGFQGDVGLSGNYLITGSAVSIKGQTFSWTG